MKLPFSLGTMAGMSPAVCVRMSGPVPQLFFLGGRAGEAVDAAARERVEQLVKSLGASSTLGAMSALYSEAADICRDADAFQQMINALVAAGTMAGSSAEQLQGMADACFNAGIEIPFTEDQEVRVDSSALVELGGTGLRQRTTPPPFGSKPKFNSGGEVSVVSSRPVTNPSFAPGPAFLGSGGGIDPHAVTRESQVIAAEVSGTDEGGFHG